MSAATPTQDTSQTPQVAVRLPGDPCECGDSRNQHSGYGDGRCLRGGCPCPRLTPPPRLSSEGRQVRA